MNIKEIIQSIFIYFNLKIIRFNNDRLRIDGIFKFIYNNDKKDLKNFLNLVRNKIFKKITILDVGANKGQSIKRFKAIAPKSIIYSYEPINTFFEVLKKNFSSNSIILNNKAVGSKIQKKIINEYPLGASSFFKLNFQVPSIKKRYFKWIKEQPKIFKKQETSVTTIDKEFKIKNLKKINILKIDTQGFEAEVLKGATTCLKKSLIDFIQIEVMISRSYKQIYISDVDIILKKYNYLLLCVESKGHNLLNNCEYQVELLYCNNLMLKKINKFHNLKDYRQFI